MNATVIYITVFVVVIILIVLAIGAYCTKPRNKIAVVLEPASSSYDATLAQQFIAMKSRYSLFFVMRDKDQIELFDWGTQQATTGRTVMYRSMRALYDDLYSRGYRYFIGYILSTSLQSAANWAKDKHDVSLISLGSAVPQFRRKQIVRLYGDYELYCRPTAPLQSALDGNELILYEPNLITTTILSYLPTDGATLVDISDGATNLPEIVSQYDNAQVLLLVTTADLLRRNDWPRREYIMPDLLLEIDIAPFPHEIMSFSIYQPYTTRQGSLLPARASYLTGAVAALSLTNWLQARRMHTSRATKSFQVEFGLDEYNDARTVSFIRWKWNPSGDKGVWSYENDDKELVNALAPSGYYPSLLLAQMVRAQKWNGSITNQDEVKTVWDATEAHRILSKIEPHLLDGNMALHTYKLTSTRIS